MDFQNITEGDIIAGVFAGIGGLIRILLGIDQGISTTKQIVFLFLAALPVGWFTYNIAVFYGFKVFAFPAGFFAGIIALSLCTTVAREGAAALLAIFHRKVK